MALAVGTKGNPYHKGKGEGGGQFTSKEQAGLDEASGYAELMSDQRLARLQAKAVFKMPKVSEASAKVLNFFTTAAGYGINRKLRGELPKTKETMTRANVLDRVVGAAHTERNIRVFRAVSGEFRKTLETMKIGTVLRDKAFLSAALTRRASYEANDQTVKTGLSSMMILVPKDSRAAFIAPYSIRPQELEVLMPRDSRLTYLGKGRGDYIFRLEPQELARGRELGPSEYQYRGPQAFISPNVANLDFERAKSDLKSQRQRLLRAAAADVDRQLGINSEESDVIGAWADGAENSLMVRMPNATLAQNRVASAMKGWLADQKSVLVFNPDPAGGEYMANFAVHGPEAELGQLHAEMLERGIAFHTLEPTAGGTTVHVYGSDQATIDLISRAASDHGTTADFVFGTGEFIGTKQEAGEDRALRDDAKREYERVIAEVSASGELPGRDVGAIWQSVRDHWGGEFAQKQEVIAAKGSKGATRAEQIARLNPTQERIDLITKGAFDAANALGFDLDQLHISKETKFFNVGGKAHQMVAASRFGGGITIYTAIDPDKVGPTMAHEVEHQKFRHFYAAVLDEYTKYIDKHGDEDLPTQTEHAARARKDGLTTYADFLDTFAAKYDTLRTKDGVTPYSKLYWKDEPKELDMQATTAMNETLAEIAAMEYEGKSTSKVDPAWMTAYKLVNDYWNRTTE